MIPAAFALIDNNTPPLSYPRYMTTNTGNRKNLLLIRNMARGDVLLCSAIARELKRRNPHYDIYFQTQYPDVFEGSPWIKQAFLPDNPPKGIGFHAKANFNIVLYEQFKGWHIIDAFAKAAGLNAGEFPKTIDFYPSQKCYADIDALVPKDPYLAIAPGPGLWEARNWKEENWQWLCSQLLKEGHKVVLVGGETNYKLESTLDLRCKTPTFGHLGAAIGRAKMFIGIDSFPIHIAGAMKTPRVGLFGVTTSKYILCDSPKTVVVSSDPSHPFTGYRHRVNSMNQIVLKRPNDNPMHTISTQKVWDAFVQLNNSLTRKENE